MTSTTITRMKHSTDILNWEIQDMNLSFDLDQSNAREIGMVESDEFEVGAATGLHSAWKFRLASKNGMLVFGTRMNKYMIAHNDPSRYFYMPDDEPGEDSFILCKYDVSLASGSTADPFLTVTQPRYCHDLSNDFDDDPTPDHPNGRTIYHYYYLDLMPIKQFVENKVEYFPDNRLWLTISITIIFQPAHTTIGSLKYAQYMTAHAKDSVVKCFAGLLNQPEFSDLTIICGQSAFLAHRVIVAARSSWFRARLSEVWAGAAGGGASLRLIMNDENPETLEKMLRFIYGAELIIPEPNEKDALLELIDAAEKYDLQDLKTASFYRMFSTVNDKNAGEFALAAYRYNANLDCTTLVQSYCIRRHAHLIKDPEYQVMLTGTPKAFIGPLENN